MEKTTIQINISTLERLKALKSFDRQSYDELIINLVENIEKESLSEEEIIEIQKGLEDIKNRRVYSIEQVAKEIGIALK